MQYSGLALNGYRDALRSTFLVGTGLVAVSMVGAVLVEWKSTKGASAECTEEQEKEGQRSA